MNSGAEKLKQMDISPEVVEAFEWLNFHELTSIQEKCIPYMMKGHDIIAIAPTGTGKTLGFGIPMLEYINVNDPKPQELVLAPTRELAQQIADDLWRAAVPQTAGGPSEEAADYRGNARTPSGPYEAA